MSQHHYTMYIGVEGSQDITPYTSAFESGGPPTYDVIVVTDPEPKPPTPPEHIKGFWAWLTGKNEKAFNDYLDEYDAYQEEWDQWLERRANNVIPNRQLFKNVRIGGGEA